MTDPTSPANVDAVLTRWARDGVPTARSEFREAFAAKTIRGAACGGRAVDHGRNGECWRLLSTSKAHGQLESLR